MAKKVPLKPIRDLYLKKIDSLKGNKNYEGLLAYLKENGENYVIHRARNETRHFDIEWINELDKGLQAIDRIIAAPKTFIKENAQVVLAGLAKRVSSASVIHLASHSQFVRGFDEEGNVIPEKILSISSEDNYQTYENRFIMSLIMKLSIFVANRYNFIKTHGEAWNSNVLLMHSKIVLDGVTYEIDNRVRLSEPSEDYRDREYNQELLDKIQLFSDRVMFYLGSPFMKKMKEAKPVHNPIAMTNILAKNPEYHAALKLWRFLDRYTQLGVDFSVDEGNVPFTDQYYDEAMNLLLGNLLTLDAKQVDSIALHEDELENVKKKTFVPRTLNNIEDIAFLNGKFQYEQYPHIKEAYEKLIRNKEEEPLAPTPEEAKFMREQEQDAQRDMVIYARDIHETQERYRDRAARAEDRKMMEGRQFFQEFWEAEKKRLDEIEAADKANREYEEELLAELRAKQSQRYEDLLLDEEKRRVMEEALHDRMVEDAALGRPESASEDIQVPETTEPGDFFYQDVPYGEFRAGEITDEHPDVPEFVEDEEPPAKEEIREIEEAGDILEEERREEEPALEAKPEGEEAVQEEQPQQEAVQESASEEAPSEEAAPLEAAEESKEQHLAEAPDQLSFLVNKALRLAKKAVNKTSDLDRKDELGQYKKETADGSEVYEFTLSDSKNAAERMENQEALEDALLETVQKGGVEQMPEPKKPEQPKVSEDRIARAMRLAMEALRMSREEGAEIKGKKKVDENGNISYEFNLKDIENSHKKD